MTTGDDHALVCEGPDDFAAIRAIFRHWEMQEQPSGASPGSKNATWHGEGVRVRLLVAEGKEDLAHRMTMISLAGVRPTLVGISFDPDDTSRAREREFFSVDARKQRKGDFSFVEGGDGLWKENKRDVVVVFGAWREPTGFLKDALPDGHHSLERVILSGLWPVLDEAEQRWLERAMSEVGDLRPNPKHRWKQAFHLANTLLEPTVGGPAFVDRLLQQSRTKHACLQALLASTAGAMLHRVCKRPT